MGKEVPFRLTRSIRKAKKKAYCPHLQVEVDEHTRTVNCAHCGSKMDAFDYILSWANQQERFEMEIPYRRRELEKLLKELEDLKRTVNYVRRKSESTVKITKTG